ncbi:MAG TPA: hypothetical protein DHV16_04015 [Nitrospiraceae bacterium]|nr:MAG: hypothetical protein A2Z82_09385 [Nitrospirae bacterium GWA2_46_11]OGW24099.1 MAG: hypothetical protein A2X55_10330 [Nitrospirae bacterium GWB2_47_37]HAK88722.1 hypothetical protein [Nitrospiraceae bacterium]HCZ11421.1 hypothetical protein [Nitrospiraceae bacterium]
MKGQIKKLSAELKVGIFALIVLVLLAFMTFKIGDIELFKGGGYTIYAYFNNIIGLDQKTKVRVAGVDAGIITGITLENGRAKVAIRMHEGVKLYSDAAAYIKITGFLGDKFLEIKPGSQPPLLKHRDTLVNVMEVTDIDGLIRNLSALSKDISALSSSIDEMVGSEEAKQSFKESIANVREITRKVGSAIDYNDKSLRKVLDDINELIKTNKDLFNATMSNLNNLSDKGPSLVEKLDKAAKELNALLEESKPGLKNSIERLDRVTGKIERGEGTVGKLIADDELYESAEKTMSGTKELIDSAKKTWPLRSYIKEPEEKKLKIDSYE